MMRLPYLTLTHRKRGDLSLDKERFQARGVVWVKRTAATIIRRYSWGSTFAPNVRIALTTS